MVDSIEHLVRVKQEQAKMLVEIQHLKENNRDEIARSLALLERFKALKRKPQIPQEQPQMLDETQHLKENNRDEIARSLMLLERFKPLKRKPQIPRQRQRHHHQTPKLNAVLKGTQGGAFVGYGKQWGCFYLGLEASYLLSNETATLGGLVFRKKNTAEVAIRSGFALGHVLFYGKLGFLSSQFQLADKSPRFKGISWGMGADIKFLPKVLLGLGYTYDVYEKKRSTDLKGSPLNLKLISHRVMFRVGYKT
ncbi:MAG: outer membrane protein [Alphaproteobacteria bacterium]